MRSLLLLALIACTRTDAPPPPPAPAPAPVIDAAPAAPAPDAPTPDAAAAGDAASAGALDLADVKARLAACGGLDRPGGPLAAIGPLVRAEPIGPRPAREAAHLIGATARAYAFFDRPGCAVVPVVGRAAAALRGSFGGGATIAYVVSTPGCSKEACATIVSLKAADDRLVDARPIEPCWAGAELTRARLFDGRDSLQVACWQDRGLDPSRLDLLLDHDGTSLATLFSADAGVRWYQVGMTDLTDGPQGDSGPWCSSRPPGGLAIVSAGPAPVIDVAGLAGEAEATAAGVEYLAGGCAQTITTRRHTFDAAARRFVAAGRPRTAIVDKLCTCPPRP